jgi:Na+/H+-dicarboxylate symporter
MNGKKGFGLEIENIQKAVAYVRDLLKKYKCTDRDIIRAQLFTEETVLYWAEQAGAHETFQIGIRKRFKTITLSLFYQGLPSNPLARAANEEEDDCEFRFIGQNILIGLSNNSYHYENGCNVVTFTLREQGINPIAALALALSAAILCGLTISRFAPSIGAGLGTSVLTPLSNAFFGLLNAIVIPFLFVSVIASIFNMENVAQMKRIFRILFGWFAGITVLAALIAVTAGMICFPLQDAGAGGVIGSGIWTQIAAMVFDMVPSNIFKSFLDGNTLQTIFLAVLTGITMLIYKGRFPVIASVISESNLILSTLLDAICSLMPWVIFICIFNMLLSGDGKALLSSIGVVLLICLCFLVLMIIGLLSVALIEKQNPFEYLQTIAPVLMIALSTASSSATLAPHTMTSIARQGIRDYLANFSIPVGALFAKPFVVMALFLMTLFMGHFYGITFSSADVISMILLVTILAIAVPPTLGMGTFLFTIMFKRFGIPLEGLAMATSLFMLLDYLMTTGDIFSINVSMLHTEHRLQQIDKKAAASFLDAGRANLDEGL